MYFAAYATSSRRMDSCASEAAGPRASVVRLGVLWPSLQLRAVEHAQGIGLADRALVVVLRAVVPGIDVVVFDTARHDEAVSPARECVVVAEVRVTLIDVKIERGLDLQILDQG